MKVLMLGWEYPPHISGGLGTACEGLTTALARKGVEIDFVVPCLFGLESAPHMHLLGASSAVDEPAPEPATTRSPGTGAATAPTGRPNEAERERATAVTPMAASSAPTPGQVRIVEVPAMLTPYLNEASYRELLETGALDALLPADLRPADLRSPASSAPLHSLEAPDEWEWEPEQSGSASKSHYGTDLMGEVARYAIATARRVRGRQYDLIHAHDWMTFPAGILVAKQTGAPLFVHIHSLEFDRAAEGADPAIVALERQGLDACTRAIAVSHYTRSLIHKIHGTPLSKISVVHNGVYASQIVRAYAARQPRKGPVVLFLGRVTFQKGPEYFIQAAKKVLEHIPDARFVMAGSGDMLPRMKTLVEELGISDSFDFPGFVRGAALEATFSTADVYVMPSVSEPFGITPLEAMSHDRPVIVSRQSGVSEVLRNALKVDFWDIERMASQIVAVLEYPELRKVIVERAREEIRHLHWDAAATKLVPIYEAVIADRGESCRQSVSTSKFTNPTA